MRRLRRSGGLTLLWDLGSLESNFSALDPLVLTCTFSVWMDPLPRRAKATRSERVRTDCPGTFLLWTTTTLTAVQLVVPRRDFRYAQVDVFFVTYRLKLWQ